MKKLIIIPLALLCLGCKNLPENDYPNAPSAFYPCCVVPWWIVTGMPDGDIPTIPEVVDVVTNTPATDNTQSCTCDIAQPLCEPDKGEECPMPWGLDVRFLAWSPSRSDWVFIGFDQSSATYENGKITGRCFVRNGKQYHYEGQRQKSSSSPMITDKTVEVKQTHRVYFKCRQ